MIDLTYLTEMEQEMILSVLKRDANLKKSEEQRVKNLQKQVHDKSKLKYLTGEWFYETKSRRHRDRIHGSDIIRASISGKKPVTILELSQMWSERPSFVNSENQDVYVPPELSGLLEEIPEQSKHYYREDSDNLPKESQDMLKTVLPSSSKQRQNPFNSIQLSSETLDEIEGQLTNGGIEPTKTPDREFLPSSGCCIAHLTNQELASFEHIQSAPLPMPKQRTITYKSQDSFSGNNSPSVKQATSPAPRSILKHSPSCSSKDCIQFHPVCCHEPKPYSHQILLSTGRVLKPPSMPVRERESQGWIDRKQVRFGPAVGRSSMKWPSKMQDGKELSEHSLLDLDSTSHLEGEEEIMHLDTSGTNSCTVQGDDGPHKKEMEAWPSLGSPGCLQHSTLNKQRQADLDQHEQCHAQSLNPQVSNLHSAQQESGKPIFLGAGTQGLSPTKTKEEDAQSLAKIRDWFSWERSDKPQAQLQPIDEPGSPVNIITDEIPSDAASEKPSNLLSLKARIRLLGIFSRWEARKEKIPAVQCSVDEDLIPSEQIKVDDALLNIGYTQSTVNTYSDQQQDQHECVVDEHSAKNEDRPDAREVRQEMDQIPQEAEKSAYGVEILPDKSFWKSDPTTLLGKLSSDSTQCEIPVSREFDMAKNATLSCPDIQHDFDSSATTKFKNFGTLSNDRHDPAMLVAHTVFQKVETSQNCNADLCAALSHDETSASSVEGNDMLEIPGVDGPFRAGSVLISEHHSSSSVRLAVASQAVQPEEKATIPLPVSPSSHSCGQRGGIQLSLVRQSLSPQQSRKAKINNLKSFWEKENTGPRVIVCKPKKALNSETNACSETSPIHQSVATSQSELRPTETDLVDYDKQSTSSCVAKNKTSGFSMNEKIGKGSAKACLNTSLRSHCNVRDVDYIIQQDPREIDILKERPSSPETCLHRSELPKWKDITDDELKRGPSKTCHPTDLHKDSSSFEGVRCDSSLLKTFLIDKVSPAREPRNEPERPTPVVRQRKGLSHEVKQLSKFSKHTQGITSSTTQIKSEKKRPVCPTMPRRGSAQSSLNSMRPSQSPTKSIPHPVRRVSLGNLGVQEDCQGSPGSDLWHLHVKRASEAIKRVPAERKLPGASKDSEMYPCPARSFIPQSNQHYLGLPVRTHIHQFISEKADPQHVTPSGNTPFPLSTRNSKGSPCLISPKPTENCVGGSSRRSMPEIWSQSRASSSCHEEDLSLIRVEKKQMTSRPLSRSMEDILSPPKREENKIDREGAINKTVNDVSAVPPSSSLSVPEQMKMISKSVSSLQNEKDGRDSDSTSVNSLIFGWKKRTGSSLTNLSVSSGMASMSSVSSSVASIYSGLERDVDVKGTIQFAINYVQKLGEFQIFVVHCRNLAVAEPKKNRSDPYVKCYLLPDKAKMGKRKTSVKKKTLNPTYNEILRFKVTMETLKTQNLNVSVWHNDNFGRNSFLGKVDLNLSEWDFSNTQMNDYALKERTTTQSVSPSPFRTIDHRGEMKIALRFLPQVSHGKRSTKTEMGEVQIWVKDCKNLPAVRDMVIDPFVKCTVLPETSRKSRQKTRVVKNTVNPMFNHTMVYDGFRPDDLRDACVEVTVWDHDRITNHFLGGLRLGLGTGKCYESVADWMDSTAEEAGLWERMMQSHNEWVEEILPLRMLIMGKGLSK